MFKNKTKKPSPSPQKTNSKTSKTKIFKTCILFWQVKKKKKKIPRFLFELTLPIGTYTSTIFKIMHAVSSTDTFASKPIQMLIHVQILSKQRGIYML